MACNNINCGCTTAGKTTLPGCDPFVCNDPNPCSSVVDSCCVIYTGDNIVDANITTGQSLCDIIPQLVTYMTPPVVTCSTPTNCCGSVTGLNVIGALDPTDPTKATFTVTWDRKENCEVSWVIQYRVSSTIPWTSVSVPSFLSSYIIIDLFSGVYYDFRMYAECEAEPCYSATISVVSPYPPCNTPEYCGADVIASPNFTTITQTSITWNWINNPSAIGYQVKLSDINGVITTVFLPAGTTTYTAAGLTPGTLYFLEVEGLCPGGQTNSICSALGTGVRTKFPCVSVIINNAGLVIDQIVYTDCNSVFPTNFNLLPGQTLNLCIQQNSLTGVSNTTRVIVVGPCP
jgi:hypothetical protein